MRKFIQGALKTFERILFPGPRLVEPKQDPLEDAEKSLKRAEESLERADGHLKNVANILIGAFQRDAQRRQELKTSFEKGLSEDTPAPQPKIKARTQGCDAKG